jgi:hypothetical protein
MASRLKLECKASQTRGVVIITCANVHHSHYKAAYCARAKDGLNGAIFRRWQAVYLCLNHWQTGFCRGLENVVENLLLWSSL